MNLLINGRFLTQRITGVQRYAHELVQAFDAIAGGSARFACTVLSPRLSVAPASWSWAETVWWAQMRSLPKVFPRIASWLAARQGF